MGHVDDAHHAKGNGQPDCGKQQDRAEAQAVDTVLDGAPDRKILLDCRNFFRRCTGDCRLTCGKTRQQRQGIAITARAKNLYGCNLF